MSRPIEYDRDIASEPHRLLVLSYDPSRSEYKCQWGDKPNQTMFLGMAAEKADIGEELVGKYIDVAYTFGYTFLAVEPRIVENKGPGPI